MMTMMISMTKTMTIMTRTMMTIMVRLKGIYFLILLGKCHNKDMTAYVPGALVQYITPRIIFAKDS